MITGGTIVYCEPGTWPSAGELVGCGPRYTSTNFYHKLGCLLHDPRVTAFGEVGLDFEGASSRERGLQLSTLRWAFQHVKEEIPLVLHLRGTRIDPLSEEVGAECRHILRDVGVSRSQKIHLHCFTGGNKEYRWTRDYSNVYFGFTRMVQNFNKEQVGVLRNLRETEFLLETDSPYFPPRGTEKGHPQYIGEITQLVVESRGRGLKETIERATRNWVVPCPVKDPVVYVNKESRNSYVNTLTCSV